MKRVKIVAVSYDYDYCDDTTIRSLSEELPWTEIDDEFYNRLIAAIPYKNRLGRSDPMWGKNIIVLEDLTPTSLDLEAFVAACEKEVKKEVEARIKREEAAKRAKEVRDAKALERKQKQLEKLKRELDGVVE